MASINKCIYGKYILLLSCLVTGLFVSDLAHADNAAEMARKLQNPLANIKAMMTDNTIGFDTGTDEGTSYSFQLQPIYAIDLPDKGFTILPRAVIPIMGLEPGTYAPIIGSPSSNTSDKWGVGDSMLQLFFAPHMESNWKWGFGPMFSMPTHTDNAFKGADWGAGAAGIIVGNITPDLSLAGIVGNMWGDSGNFNSLSLQPMLYYNIPSKPGAAIAYNAMITANWEADNDNRWTVPLGLTYSQALDMGGGHGLELSMGPYYNVVRPEGAARWQLRFGVNWLFP
jgi:hypothetical protein